MKWLSKLGKLVAPQREEKERRELATVQSDFIQLTIHELRRPLGLINGYLPMIQEGDYGPVPETMQPGLKLVEAAASEMSALLDGLAAISLIEDRTGVLHREPTWIGSLIRDAVASMKAEATAKEITVEVKPSSSYGDIQVVVDPHLMKVAVINLLGNAIKYSPEQSKVKVWAGMNPRLIIRVIDQGPGIEPTEAERIFTKWHRAPSASPTGLGLGLYLVRRIVNLHGGRVILESTPGSGSTFSIVLPN